MHLENMMTVNFKRLDCTDGCCKDKMKFLFEKEFAVQDDMYNILAAENISLGNFVVDEIMPFLERRTLIGDTAAEDLLIDLTSVLAGKS
jgi:hypothetical protein